jgi:hypothetical protein
VWAGTQSRCLNTILPLRQPGSDPDETVLIGIVREWFYMWIHKPWVRPRIVKAWPSMFGRIRRMEPSQRWSSVRGPMSSLMVALLEAGWIPAKPDMWLSAARKQGEFPGRPKCRESVIASKIFSRDEWHFTT